jgi:hypothetical protein
MEEDQNVKLRVLNGHTETFALHIHGHKPTVTHYDGVDNGPSSYIQRDVHGLTPAQRLDLSLSGKDDGLNSFGQGIWMFHDHVEKSFTTNGHGEGGDISLVVYKGFYDDKGIPMSHGMSLAPYFTKELWQGKYPIWQDYDTFRSLGLPDLKAPVTPAKTAILPVEKDPSKTADALMGTTANSEQGSVFGKLFNGFVLGLIGFVGFTKRQRITDFVMKLLKK